MLGQQDTSSNAFGGTLTVRLSKLLTVKIISFQLNSTSYTGFLSLFSSISVSLQSTLSFLVLNLCTGKAWCSQALRNLRWNWQCHSAVHWGEGMAGNLLLWWGQFSGWRFHLNTWYYDFLPQAEKESSAQNNWRGATVESNNLGWGLGQDPRAFLPT